MYFIVTSMTVIQLSDSSNRREHRYRMQCIYSIELHSE